jgi:hypothetical protein
MIILAIAMALDMMAPIALTMHAIHLPVTMAAPVSLEKPPQNSAVNALNTTLVKIVKNTITVRPCHAFMEELAATEQQPSIAIALEQDMWASLAQFFFS